MPEVNVSPINEAGAISVSMALSTTPAEIMVGTGRLSGRRGLYLKNTSTIVEKWGFSSGACVHPLAAESSAGDGKGGDIWIDVGDKQAVFIVAVSGTPTVSVSKLK